MKNLVDIVWDVWIQLIVYFIVTVIIGLSWRWMRQLIQYVLSRAPGWLWPRKPEQRPFLIVCLIVVVIAVWNEMIGPRFSGYSLDTEAETLIHSHRWITYDPLYFDPFLLPNPEARSMSQELEWIRNAGFDGIITLTSRQTLSLIPELAKEKGLLVIMGVWDPTDRQEVAAAISQREHVDAYCVGHNGLRDRYSYGDLVRVIRHIRFRTKRPVSTTEHLRQYLDDKRLLKLGDWIFPDSHVSIEDGSDAVSSGYLASAVRDANQTIEQAKAIAKTQGEKGKPILLKMVTYPARGIRNASLEEQAEFFRIILDRIRNPLSDWPSRVSISVHSAFDMPWKSEWPFHEWDPYTGLLNHDGTPRPAVQKLVGEWR